MCYRISEGYVRNALRAQRRRHSLLSALVRSFHPDSGKLPDAAELAGDRVRELLLLVSETDREVLSLAMDGYRVAEIAEVLGCTPPAATMRLRRARANMRELLGEDGSLGEVGLHGG